MIYCCIQKFIEYLGVIAVMLLSRSLPFHGSTTSEVRQRILANNYHFKGRRWKTVSPQAKTFIRELLVTDPDDRIDAETALGSQWLSGSVPTNLERALRPEEEDMARSSMLSYANYPKLKKMVSKNFNQHEVIMIQ